MRSITKINSITWTSSKKDRVLCRCYYDDDTTEVLSIPADDTNDDWKKVLEFASKEDIDAFTIEAKRVEENDKLNRIQRDKEASEVKKASTLFNAKVEAFDIPEVISAPKELKARIRKATSSTQVIGLVALCFLKAMDKQDEQQ